MKKIFTTFLLLSAAYTSAFSQQKNSFEFGLNVGLNTSTVKNTRVNSDFRSGFNVTGFGEYFFSDRWGVKVKLGYDQKGWNNGFIELLETDQSFSTDFHFNYLTIPVLANWHFGKKRNWYLNFGPYVGLLLNANETQFDTDLKEFAHNTDIGFDLGIGVKIPVAKRVKVLLELDGQSGFTEMFKVISDGSTSTTRRSSFNAGLVFNLK